MPAFNVATRGMAYFHLTLRTGARDLHSGMYGGAALNAAHALIADPRRVIAVDGRLAEPLRAGIIAPTAAGAGRLAASFPPGPTSSRTRARSRPTLGCR